MDGTGERRGLPRPTSALISISGYSLGYRSKKRFVRRSEGFRGRYRFENPDDHIEVFDPITFSSPMLLVRLVRSHDRSAERYGRSRRPDVPN